MRVHGYAVDGQKELPPPSRRGHGLVLLICAFVSRTIALFVMHGPVPLSRVLRINWSIVKRTKMPNLRNGSKGGFEPGLT